VPPYAQAAHAQVRRELEIRVAIPHDRAAGEIYAAHANVLLHETDIGLATGAAVGLEMRADENRIELDSLRAQRLQNEPLRPLEVRLREGVGP
jgi:hypothetical protein